MGNLHLVTGCAGTEHITAADQGAFNAALIGTGQFVLDKGGVFEAQVISNNQIRVLDGELMMQGRFVRLNPDTYVDLAIESGTQGMQRNDLIVVRYTKDAVTGVEGCDLVVIKGTADASNPSDPAFTEGDITNGAATQNDFPLWRIPISGINVGTPEAMFGEPFADSMLTLPAIRHQVENIHKEVDAKIKTLGMIYAQIFVTAQTGSDVTCVKGNTVLKANEIGGVWTFNVTEYGEWEVVCPGYQSVTVNVDAVKQYNVYLYDQRVNYVMLYDFGDECTGKTGGWTHDGYAYITVEGTVYNATASTKNKTNMHVQIKAGSTACFAGTNNTVNTNGYSHINGLAAASKGDLTVAQTKSFNASGMLTTLEFGSSKSIKSGMLPETVNNVYVAAFVLEQREDYITIYALWLTKEDAWRNLCSLVGISATGTLAELLANSEALTSILASEHAVNYMIKNCTGDFMTSAVSSSTFLAVLEKSKYKEQVYANEHWAKFLAMVA